MTIFPQQASPKKSEQIAGAPPPLAVEDDEPSPIGTTKDYEATVRANRRVGARIDRNDPALAFDTDVIQSVAPAYYPGFEYLFASADETAIFNIQRSLVSAGLMADEFRKGVWDDDTTAGFKEVLAYANRAGITWQQALEEYATAGEAIRAARPGPKGPVFVARLSNPDDLRKVLKQAAFNVLGGKFFAPELEDEFVAKFQDTEYKAQRAAFDAQVAGGGTVVDNASASTTAETTLEELDAAGVQAKRYADYGRVLEGLLDG